MSDATPRNFATGDQHAAHPAPAKAEGWEASFVRGLNDASANLVSGGKSDSMFGLAAAEHVAPKPLPTHLDCDQADIYKSVYQNAA